MVATDCVLELFFCSTLHLTPLGLSPVHQVHGSGFNSVAASWLTTCRHFLGSQIHGLVRWLCSSVTIRYDRSAHIINMMSTCRDPILLNHIPGSLSPVFFISSCIPNSSTLRAGPTIRLLMLSQDEVNTLTLYFMPRCACAEGIRYISGYGTGIRKSTCNSMVAKKTNKQTSAGECSTGTARQYREINSIRFLNKGFVHYYNFTA